VHVVRAGTVELSREIKGRRVTLQVLQPGDVFGDVPVFLGDPEPFDARAVEDCTVLELDAAALYHLLQTRPMVARRWFISLAERMAGLQNRLVDLLAGGIEAQLASILLREADARGRVRITQSNLAGLLGAQRSSIQRVLKSLQTAGLIELHYRCIDLVDRGGLVSLLDEPEEKRSKSSRASG
jgi:CRP-like cAMP-binding protein